MNVTTSKFQEDLKHLLFLEAKKVIITKEIIDNQSKSNQSDYIEVIQQRIKILQNEIVNLSTELNLNNKTQVEKCNVEANLDSEIVFDTELNEILDQCHKDIRQHTNHHKDSLNSKTSPLYTLPNAFKYEIKMRDTKMKGMSMYENPSSEKLLSDLNISNSSSSTLSPKSQQSVPSKNNSPATKWSTAPTALALQGSKERENELQYFFDTSPTLAHSIHDLTQSIGECAKDGLNDHGVVSNESSLCRNDDDEHSLVDGIEFCIVEADWLRLQTTSSVVSSASLASTNSSSMSDQLVSIAANRSSALLTPLLPPHRSWRYPHDLEDNSLVNNTKELQDQSFFFPSGVKVELVACAVAELRSKTSQHIRHVVPFTNGQGKPTYACVLTISQIYDSSEISIQGDNIVPNLVKINKQKQASTCIQKCFRQFLAYRKVQNWQMRRTGHNISGPNSPANTINNSVSGDVNNNSSGASAPTISFRSSLFRTHSSRMSDTSVHGGVGGTNSSSGVNTPAKYSDSSNNSNPSNTVNRQNNNNNTRRTFLSYFSRNTAINSAISQSSAIQAENNEVINNTTEDSMNTNTIQNENLTTTISTSDHCKSNPSIQPIVDDDSRTSLGEGKELLGSPIINSSSSKNRFLLDKDSIAQYISKKAIVAQKAYCIISTSQQYTFIFKVLDAIAAAEAANKVSSLVDINNRSEQRNRFLELVETFLITNLVNRKIRSNPLHQLSRSLITRSMKKYSLRSNNNTTTNIYNPNPTTYDSQVNGINKKLQQHIRVPGYISDFKINLDRLLSTQEWTCAVLFTHLNSQIIFKIINLLLMEKSLIIHGRNAGIVTTITMAVINLISPFAWEGIFVPLVPDNARELFGAPVPLIVGTTSPPRINDVSADTAILFLNDDNVITSPVNNTNSSTADVEGYDATLQSSTSSSADNNNNEEVNVVKLEMKFVAWFVRLPEVSADMPFELEICRRIDYTSMLLCNHCYDKIEFKYQELEGRSSIKASKGGSPRPSEHKRVGSITTMSTKNKSPFTSNCRIANTIDSLLMSEVPLKILEQVRILISSIQRYNYGFCGCVLEEPGTWKRFLKHSNRTGTDEFYPEYFMEPLRNHLEFQDAIVHTQLFVSFMDKLHKEHIEMDNYRLDLFPAFT